MGLITSSKTKPLYDVIVVGSGAGGGMASYVLAKAGVKVLMLEAGRNYDPITETPMFQTPVEAPLRDADTPDRPIGFFTASIGGFYVPGEPYMVSRSDTHRWAAASHSLEDQGGQSFQWWRSRMLGGRTNHWGRVSLRMGPYDLKPRSRDGLGFDWPISYEELAPYYDKTEALIGVFGSNEGLENTPDSSPGILQTPPKPRAYELLTKKACQKLGIPVIPSHAAVLTSPLNGRSACFYATNCGRGCSIRANFQSTTVLIPPAVATGNLDILPNAMVREIAIDSRGLASGVNYVDKLTGKNLQVRARVVVLAASACESARILLNSRSATFSHGLANSSGKVGKYLMDTVGTSLFGQIPALENCPPHNEDGISSAHMYMPWWLYQEQLAGKLNFPRGYHIEFIGTRFMPSTTNWAPEVVTGGTYGRKFKEDVRRFYGTWIRFSGRGEMIPNESSYCEIDPHKKDQWGIPVLRFHWKWSEYETRQAAHMHKKIAEIIETMGGSVYGGPEPNGAKAINNGGSVIHEVGTTIMGSRQNSSVLNSHCQSWDVKNLFVADGGPFASNADKNPTLTILALAMRTSEYIVEQLKARNIG